MRKLVQVPQYREKFLKRYAELFNSVLTTENMVSLFYEMTAQIKPEMQMHSERWATEMSPKVSFDVPKNATGAYNYWLTRCERTVRRHEPPTALHLAGYPILFRPERRGNGILFRPMSADSGGIPVTA